MNGLSLDSRVVLASDVVSQELEGELVILSLDRAEYYGLNPTGTRVWKSLAEGATIAVIAERLAAECHVDLTRARHDVLALVRSLVDEKLAMATHAPPSP